ncbi:UNVERIFIED_CONTAM: Callose synthase 9, partial [Sesamum indicum]
LVFAPIDHVLAKACKTPTSCSKTINVIQQMGRELEEILRQQVAQPASSCVSESGVSFIDQVICPLYDVIAA